MTQPHPVRTLAVWCLDWPVVASGHDPDSPVAVLVANRVVASSVAARDLGVSRGLRKREAQGRCPQLIVVERDLAREARAFEPVLAAVEEFTPRVELTRPGRCAFATRGPSRYFGGDEALVDLVYQRVTEALEGRTVCRVGIADGPFAAELAARHRRAIASGSLVVAPDRAAEFLAPLAISSLERPELCDVLFRLGLKTLGDFAKLPGADVLARFAGDGLLAHRLASGLDERPPNTRLPAVDLSFAAEIEPPAERVDQAAFVARSLAEKLQEALEQRGAVCTNIAIEAETEHGETQVRLWRHEGALSAAAIVDRARWQLDGWLNGCEASRPTGGLNRLVLIPEEVVAAKGRQLGFWGGATEMDERAMRALTRVQAMLGAEAVCVPEVAGGRSPAQQIRLVPVATTDIAARVEQRSPVQAQPQACQQAQPSTLPPWPGRLPAPSPAMVHGSSVPVGVVDADGNAVSVSGRGVISQPPNRLVVPGKAPLPIEFWAGPWPIDERWWDDRTRRRCARLQVVTADGVARLLVLEGGAWFVEATYD